MITSIKIIYSIFLFALLFIMLFSFLNCSGSNQINLPSEVCEYGNLTCSVAESLCEQNIIPDNICYYFTLSCINLNYLCEDTTSAKTKELLLLQQKILNEKVMKEALNYGN
ncbi:MAG: hypothetical protein IT232_08590 [Flavobacteriales bacterium]|nr:hypothetical protein [Flavobacteriales bacterium]